MQTRNTDVQKKSLDIKFDNPPIRVTANGSLSIAANDILHSRAGQDIILRMAKMIAVNKKEPAGKAQ